MTLSGIINEAMGIDDDMIKPDDLDDECGDPNVPLEVVLEVVLGPIQDRRRMSDWKISWTVGMKSKRPINRTLRLVHYQSPDPTTGVLTSRYAHWGPLTQNKMDWSLSAHCFVLGTLSLQAREKLARIASGVHVPRHTDSRWENRLWIETVLSDAVKCGLLNGMVVGIAMHSAQIASCHMNLD